MIGHNVKLFREKLGLTQEELAFRMGYKSKSTINKIEKNINDVNQTKINQLAKALNCDPSDLMVSQKKEKREVFEVSDEEKDLLRLFRQLSDDQKAMILGAVKAAYEMKKGNSERVSAS